MDRTKGNNLSNNLNDNIDWSDVNFGGIDPFRRPGNPSRAAPQPTIPPEAGPVDQRQDPAQQVIDEGLPPSLLPGNLDEQLEGLIHQLATDSPGLHDEDLFGENTVAEERPGAGVGEDPSAPPAASAPSVGPYQTVLDRPRQSREQQYQAMLNDYNTRRSGSASVTPTRATNSHRTSDSGASSALAGGNGTFMASRPNPAPSRSDRNTPGQQPSPRALYTPPGSMNQPQQQPQFFTAPAPQQPPLYPYPASNPNPYQQQPQYPYPANNPKPYQQPSYPTNQHQPPSYSDPAAQPSPYQQIPIRSRPATPAGPTVQREMPDFSPPTPGTKPKGKKRRYETDAQAVMREKREEWAAAEQERLKAARAAAGNTATKRPGNSSSAPKRSTRPKGTRRRNETNAQAVAREAREERTRRREEEERLEQEHQRLLALGDDRQRVGLVRSAAETAHLETLSLEEAERRLREALGPGSLWEQQNPPRLDRERSPARGTRSEGVSRSGKKKKKSGGDSYYYKAWEVEKDDDEM